MSTKERIVSPELLPIDDEVDLRPYQVNDFTGQSHIKEIMEISLLSAKKRSQPMDHVLLYGPPGLGKTTLAYIIASEMGSKYHRTTGPALERGGDLAAILSDINRGDVLFIDEIHRLNYLVEEMLYSVMEDFKLDIILGRGSAARTLVLNFPPFTIVGATTKAGMLSSPLRDRFGFSFRFRYYEESEIVSILKRAAGLMKVEIEDDALSETARRSRGTPRVALRLAKRIRDYALAKNQTEISLKLALDSFNLLNIDELGLDDVDRMFLKLIFTNFNGGPVGLESIAYAMGEDKKTIEDIIEPFLLQKGLLVRTGRGRVLTPLCLKHLNLETETKSLFNG
ncbi:MAG: Holliday junction ATP-dependent DNA helicase RuvB [candidate division WS2 bacterium]|nr:Holliday junction ATP-dependent DNA helicase RuvB [Candidatus Psychracetigena formicireducens]